MAQREVLRQPVPEAGLQCWSCGLPQRDTVAMGWGQVFLNHGLPVALWVRRRLHPCLWRPGVWRRQAAVLAPMENLPC